MFKVIIFSLLPTFFLTSPSFSAPREDYLCLHDRTIVKIFKGNGEPVSEDTDNNPFVQPGTYKIEIYEDNNTLSYTNWIAFDYDGAGQESFQVFTAGSSLQPLKKVVEFYTEHEGWVLEGGYFSEVQNTWVDFPSQKMKCIIFDGLTD